MQKQKKLINEKVELLSRLKESWSDDILELILSGEHELAQKSIDEYEILFEDCADDIGLMLNRNMLLAAGSDGDREEAASEFRRIGRNQRQFASTIAPCICVSRHKSGMGYWDNVPAISEYEPNSFIDYLFRGNALIFSSPDLAIRDLAEAIDRKPSSGIAALYWRDSIANPSMYLIYQKLLN